MEKRKLKMKDDNANRIKAGNKVRKEHFENCVEELNAMLKKLNKSLYESEKEYKKANQVKRYIIFVLDEKFENYKKNKLAIDQVNKDIKQIEEQLAELK